MDVRVARVEDAEVPAEALNLVSDRRNVLRRNTSVAREVLAKLLGMRE